MNKLFYYKKYADNVYYCYYLDWTIKIVRIFGIKIMWIKKIGYGIEAVESVKTAREFLHEKKSEYINAKKYIKL